MNIKRRKKYFLALAQAATPASPTSPTSPTAETTPTAAQTPKTPVEAFDASVFRSLNVLWGSSNAETIRKIIELLNKGLHILSMGAVNMNTIKNNNFDFGKAEGLMPKSPGIEFLAFVKIFYNQFLLNSTKDGVSELTADQKKKAKESALSAFGSLLPSVNITDPSFNKESIRTNLNNIDANLEPTRNVK